MVNKKSKKEKIVTSLLIIIVVIMIIIVSVVIRNNKDNENISNNSENSIENNSSTDPVLLIGTFVYDIDGTKYEFKEDGTGSMISNNYNFEYKYTAMDGNLEIDFVAEEVHDVKYTYSINNNTLTLVSVEGTVSAGEEYKLEKENK